MNAQNAAHYILVDLDAKGQPDLLGNARTSPILIPLFHCDHGVDEFLVRPLRARPMPALGRKQQAVLSFPQQVMETEESGRLHNDGGTQEASRAQEKGAQSDEDTIRGAQVGRTLTAALEDSQLMFDEHRFGNHATETSRPR